MRDRNRFEDVRSNTYELLWCQLVFLFFYLGNGANGCCATVNVLQIRGTGEIYVVATVDHKMSLPLYVLHETPAVHL